MVKIINKTTKGCFHSCHFFDKGGQLMRCKHPFFDDKDYFDAMIINQDNSRDGKIPEKCPLREDEVELITKVKLEIKNGR